MGVSYNLVNEKGEVDIKRNKPCFAAVNFTHLDNVTKIQYEPFTRWKWSNDCDHQIKVQEIDHLNEEETEVALKWWSTLLQLPFFANCILNYENGDHVRHIPKMFEVSTEVPADRMMIVLFFLRAPQQNEGTMKTFRELVFKEKVDPKLAMLMSCFLFALTDNEEVTDYMIRDSECREYTLISKYAFSIKDVKTAMQNEFSSSFSEENDRSKQRLFSVSTIYRRTDNHRKNALAAYFNKNRAISIKTGNLCKTLEKAFAKETPDYYRDVYIRSNNIQQVIGFFKGIAA
jgi:hypothetical protein